MTQQIVHQPAFPKNSTQLEQVADILFDASSSYLSWLFDSATRARTMLLKWLVSPGSVYSQEHLTALISGTDVIAAMLCMPATAFISGQKRDLLSILTSFSAKDRAALQDRLQRAKTHSPGVAPDEFFIRALAVAPAFRGQGRGKMLFQDYLAQGSRKGFKRFRLFVEKSNTSAIALYSKFGFQQTDELKTAEKLDILSLLKQSDNHG